MTRPAYEAFVGALTDALEDEDDFYMGEALWSHAERIADKLVEAGVVTLD